MQVRWLDPILPPDLAIEPNFDRVIRKTNGIFGWSGEKPVENNVPAVRLQSPQITFRLGLGMSMLFVRPRGTIYSDAAPCSSVISILSAKEVMFSSQGEATFSSAFVCLLTGIRKTVEPIITNVKATHGPRKKPLDFGGNKVYITLGLGMEGQ